MKTTLIFFLAFILGSCASNDSKPSTALSNTSDNKSHSIKPLVVEGEEEGWGADIRLSIISTEETDTTTIHKAVSTYNQKNVGLILIIPKAKEGAKGFGKGITFQSIGVESDNLLQTIAILYKLKADSSLKFVNATAVTYVNLREFAKGLTGQEDQSYIAGAEYKLFFESEKDYAELYVNVNPDEHWIELKEKDEEYRPAIIQFLKK